MAILILFSQSANLQSLLTNYVASAKFQFVERGKWKEESKNPKHKIQEKKYSWIRGHFVSFFIRNSQSLVTSNVTSTKFQPVEREKWEEESKNPKHPPGEKSICGLVAIFFPNPPQSW